MLIPLKSPVMPRHYPSLPLLLPYLSSSLPPLLYFLHFMSFISPISTSYKLVELFFFFSCPSFSSSYSSILLHVLLHSPFNPTSSYTSPQFGHPLSTSAFPFHFTPLLLPVTFSSLPLFHLHLLLVVLLLSYFMVLLFPH